MFNFKDPKDFESSLPPVPDVQAWLKEFHSKNSSASGHGNKHNEKYEKQISSLHSRNNDMRLQFETIEKSNNDIHKKYNKLKLEHEKLKNELLESSIKIQHITKENDELKIQKQSNLNEIEQLKKQINNNEQIEHAQIEQIENNENINNINDIKWNFNCLNQVQLTTNSSSTVHQISKRKRPRSNSQDKEINKLSQTSNTSHLDKKKKTSHSSYSRSTSTSKSQSIEAKQQKENKSIFAGIFDKKLPNNLDLIRGDILAEAGYTEQIVFSFNLLKKCSTDEWQLRNFLMEMIGGLIVENSGCDDKIIYESRQIIKKQLTDLRSAIVKTTCELISTCSKYIGFKFSPSLTYFIPVHLQGLYVTIAVIRDSHNQCLTTCINNTRSFKCITPLLKGLQNKHPEVRVKAINLLTTIITLNDNNNHDKRMEKYADAISNTIKTYICDANSNVRDAVKTLFKQFIITFPHKTKFLLSRLDSTSVRTLRKFIPNNNHTEKKNNKISYAQLRTRRKGK